MEGAHSILCQKFGPFISGDLHCHRIIQFFQYKDPYNHNPICDWLQIAGGIKAVEYFSGLQHDDSIMWCRPAYEYEDEKSKFHSKLIKQLTIFTYIYSGFELFLDDLDIDPCPAYKGKIHSACYFLKTHFDNVFPMPQFYSGLIVFYKTILTKSPWYKASGNLLKPRNCAGISSEGIAIVYDIRNQFAHGAFKFIDPYDYSLIRSYDTSIIAASSRILLLTMQMILLVLNQNADFNIGGNPFEAEVENDIDVMNSAKFLQNLHLKSAINIP